jgi:hypothetical protein
MQLATFQELTLSRPSLLLSNPPQRRETSALFYKAINRQKIQHVAEDERNGRAARQLLLDLVKPDSSAPSTLSSNAIETSSGLNDTFLTKFDIMWRPDLFSFCFLPNFPPVFLFFVCSIPTIFSLSYSNISEPEARFRNQRYRFNFFLFFFTQTRLPSITYPVSFQTALLFLFVDLYPSGARW